MAGKPRNRIELRRQHEAAEPPDPMEIEGDEEVSADVAEVDERPKKKAKAAPKKPKAPRATKASKAAKPAARMRVVWQVVNDAFKIVGTFDFNNREAAEAKAAEMIAKGKGNHFLQKAKEAMPDDAPGLGATIPRAVIASAKATIARPKTKPVADEPEEEEDDAEEEEEEDDDDE